jgi:hypothetical protein
MLKNGVKPNLITRLLGETEPSRVNLPQHNRYVAEGQIKQH